jgi:hypothetical protein
MVKITNDEKVGERASNGVKFSDNSNNRLESENRRETQTPLGSYR